jgi:hypothetical protein
MRHVPLRTADDGDDGVVEQAATASTMRIRRVRT